MAMAQDGNIAVNDLVFGGIIRVAPNDAIALTNKYPARFTFNDPDPRPGIATLAGFRDLYEYTVLPIITGSRGGNAALASLLSALSSLGLVVDNST